MDFTHKKIAILGLGVEGMSSAHFLVQKGAIVTLLDQKEEKELNQSFVTALKNLGVEIKGGEDYLDHLEEYDIIVRSPGIKALSPQLQKAKETGITVTSQTQLFLELCPCPVIGVTGTKGKGTTSTLILEMLRKQGKDAYLGGNIGLPPFTFLEKLTPESVVVLEMSSFQLQDITISPHIAVMLMVTSEHLDYHHDTYEYIEAKRNIFKFQTKTDFAVINRDYPASLESDIYTEGTVYFVSRERSADQGCFVKEEKIVVVMDGKEEEIVETKEILLPGKHNLENVCASVMAAKLAGVSTEAIGAVLKTFTGLEHRLELVKEIKGVKYYDDSFSTTPETAIAAIEAFTEPEILILGGSSKGSDFSDLGKVINQAKNIKAIIGIGVEWERIKEHLTDSHILLIEGAKDMPTIVQAASKLAKEGDVVLLSPACASFGMFENYKDRGNQFKMCVENL